MVSWVVSRTVFPSSETFKALKNNIFGKSFCYAAEYNKKRTGQKTFQSLWCNIYRGIKKAYVVNI